jgi:hypothetical protein
MRLWDFTTAFSFDTNERGPCFWSTSLTTLKKSWDPVNRAHFGLAQCTYPTDIEAFFGKTLAISLAKKWLRLSMPAFLQHAIHLLCYILFKITYSTKRLAFRKNICTYSDVIVFWNIDSLRNLKVGYEFVIHFSWGEWGGFYHVEYEQYCARNS